MDWWAAIMHAAVGYTSVLLQRFTQYIHEDLGPNLNAQWEEARKKDLGFEMGFFKNQLTMVVDLFNEYRTTCYCLSKSVTMLGG
jgi:hypothetical protein